MNEFTIREKLLQALGETTYPPSLTSRIESALLQPPHAQPARGARIVGLVAAVLAVVIISTLVYVGANNPRRPSPVIPITSSSPAPLASPSPSPTPTPTPSPSGAVLCRLPIDRGDGAFVDIPVTPVGGAPTVTADPASDVKLPNGDVRAGLTYDWTMKLWLPVPPAWVAPDGSSYAYIDSQGRVHDVAIAAGTDSVVASGAIWGLYGLTSDSIYAGQRDPSKQPSLQGLWQISPAGGAPHELTAQGTWLAIGAGAAWSVVQEPQGGQVSAPENSYGTVLDRLDLGTGQVTTWFTSPGPDFRVVTVSASGQVALISVTTTEHLWVVTAPGAANIFSNIGITDAMADSHGIWYVVPYAVSVYLVTGANSRQMSQYGFNSAMKFAGPCQ